MLLIWELSLLNVVDGEPVEREYQELLPLLKLKQKGITSSETPQMLKQNVRSNVDYIPLHARADFIP